MSEMRAPIVVGIDGAMNMEHAVDWAAGEAVRRGLPLELLHAQAEVWRAMVGDPALTPPEHYLADTRDDLPQCLVDAGLRVQERWPTVDVSVRVVALGAPYALVTASAAAAMVVVGARGRSLAGRILLGSVSHHVAAHARCPTAVVKRTTGDTTLPVVVGVDESPTSHDTLELAVEEALQREVPLVAIHAWLEPTVPGYGMWALPADVEAELEVSARQLLADALEPWTRKYSALKVYERVVRAHPVDALLGAAERAQLLVVGSHGRGAFPGMLIGSVASGVVQHADCPVIVAPPATGRPAS